MYEIIICDDDAIFINYIKKMLLEGGLNTECVNFYEYYSGEELLEDLAKHEAVDLLILDMQMKKMDGDQTAKKFREKFPATILVFCSGKCQPTFKSFEVLPYRYLLKEFTDAHMFTAINEIVKEIKVRKKKTLITGQYFENTIRLFPEEIIYISVARHGSQIHINSEIKKYDFEEQVFNKQKVEELYDILKEEGFAYAHNSYIVNLRYVKRVTVTELEFLDGTRLSIARSKAKNFRAAFAQWLGRKYE